MFVIKPDNDANKNEKILGNTLDYYNEDMSRKAVGKLFEDSAQSAPEPSKSRLPKGPIIKSSVDESDIPDMPVDLSFGGSDYYSEEKPAAPDNESPVPEPKSFLKKPADDIQYDLSIYRKNRRPPEENMEPTGERTLRERLLEDKYSEKYSLEKILADRERAEDERPLRQGPVIQRPVIQRPITSSFEKDSVNMQSQAVKRPVRSQAGEEVLPPPVRRPAPRQSMYFDEVAEPKAASPKPLSTDRPPRKHYDYFDEDNNSLNEPAKGGFWGNAPKKPTPPMDKPPVKKPASRPVQASAKNVASEKPHANEEHPITYSKKPGNASFVKNTVIGAFVVLLIILGFLIFKLNTNDSSLAEAEKLKTDYEASKTEIENLKTENGKLTAQIKELNDELTTLKTPKEETPVEVEETEDSPAPDGVTTYTVEPGDNLSKISSKVYGTPNNYQKIKDANNLTDNNVYAGQVLKIPQ